MSFIFGNQMVFVNEKGVLTPFLFSTDPQSMLTFLRDSSQLSERKARLFAAACCRSIWPLLTEDRSKVAVEVAERCADGQLSSNNLAQVYEAASTAAAHFPAETVWFAAGRAAADVARSYPPHAAVMLVRAAIATAGAAAGASPTEPPIQATLLRDIVGNPFRPPPLSPPLLDTIVRLAIAAYEERQLPSGHIDWVRLAVLADALEEAGADAELIGHLRDPGPHVRGCHILDLILGKE